MDDLSFLSVPIKTIEACPRGLRRSTDGSHNATYVKSVPSEKDIGKVAGPESLILGILVMFRE